MQEMIIPAGKAGLIIGKGGETIKQLQVRVVGYLVSTVQILENGGKRSVLISIYHPVQPVNSSTCLRKIMLICHVSVVNITSLPTIPRSELELK